MLHPRTPLLPLELQQQVDAELRAGEKLVWAAQPIPSLFGRQGIGFVVFGVPFTAFAIFWITMAAHGIHQDHNAGPAVFFPLFGLIPLLVGLGMLTSPIWIRKSAKRTIYVITDQRAIVFKAKITGSVEVQTFMPDRLTSMTRNQRADGRGDLIFEQFNQRAGSGTTTVNRGFIALENVREVEDLIAQTLLAGRTRAL